MLDVQAAMSRGYHQLELYALKPLELFLPPSNHSCLAWSDLGRLYDRTAWVHGEIFSPYLGLIGTIALLWLGFEFTAQAARGKRTTLHLPTCLWVLLFSVPNCATTR